MKTNFAKKIIKISTVVFLTFFLSFIFAKAEPQEFNLEEQLKMSEQGESTTEIDSQSKYYNTETEITDSVSGENIVETKKYKKGDKYEVTQTIQKPNDGISGGEITEEYTDSTGQKWYRTGKVNQNNDITSWNGWEKGEKTEIKTTGGEKFTYTLLQKLPKEGGNLKENVTLKQYLTWAFRFTLALAGFLAVMMIVIGGVEWIISGANESSRSDAKKRINNAISGLVLALVSYLVLYTINPSLVDFNNNCFFKDCDEKTVSSGASERVAETKTVNKDDNLNNGYIDDMNYKGF